MITWPNKSAALEGRDNARVSVEDPWRGVGEPSRSMKALVAIAMGTIFVGCGPPPPVPKSTHIQEVQQSIVRAGGVTNLTNESRRLFACLSQKKREANFYGAEDPCFRGLPGITNLGDV